MTAIKSRKNSSSSSEYLTDFDWKASTSAYEQPKPSCATASVKAGSCRDLTYILDGGGKIVITLDEPLCQPTHQCILKIIDLLKFKENWDSFGAKKIDQMIGVSALEFLLSRRPKFSPLPSIVPTVEGGLQFEWHQNGVDFELTFSGDNEIHVWFEDLRSGNSEEFVIQDNFESLAPLFDRLSSVM